MVKDNAGLILDSIMVYSTDGLSEILLSVCGKQLSEAYSYHMRLQRHRVLA